MPLTVCLLDESVSGDLVGSAEISLASTVTTLRDILRERLRTEVPEQLQPPAPFEIDQAEQLLNYHERPPVDPEQQMERAIRSFKANGFFVIAGGRQILDLDEELHLKERDEVRFIRLVPLIGG